MLWPQGQRLARRGGIVIGPEEMLAKYEAFLKEHGEADHLTRLYPRDFWPLLKEAINRGASRLPCRARPKILE